MTNYILNFEALKQKAHRELKRLESAEKDMNTIEAIDHALNAAFTIYHLLEWRENPEGLTQQEFERKIPGAHGICTKLKNPAFDLLHGIVTHTKHTTVSKRLPNSETAPPHIPDYTLHDSNLLQALHN